MKRKWTAGESVFQIVVGLLFVLFAFVCLYPFWYILMYSFSSTAATAVTPPYFWFKGFTLANYEAILLNQGIAQAALVSVSRTLAGTFLTVALSAFFAYLMTKNEMPYRKLIYRVVIVTMYLNAGLIPTYILYQRIHILNTFWIYVLPGMVAAYYVILIKTYIESIPPALEESAMMDGAGYIRIFRSVIMPLSKPILATVIVFSAVGQWNSFSDNVIFVHPQSLQTLQLILYRVLANVTEAFQSVNTQEIARIMAHKPPSPMTIRMTITMVVTLPIIFVYPFLQRYFIKGIMLGAVKG